MNDRPDRFDSVVDYEREASRDPGLEDPPSRYEDAPDAAELAELEALNRAAARRSGRPDNGA